MFPSKRTQDLTVVQLSQVRFLDFPLPLASLLLYLSPAEVPQQLTLERHISRTRSLQWIVGLRKLVSTLKKTCIRKQKPAVHLNISHF